MRERKERERREEQKFEKKIHVLADIPFSSSGRDPKLSVARLGRFPVRKRGLRFKEKYERVLLEESAQ